MRLPLDYRNLQNERNDLPAALICSLHSFSFSIHLSDIMLILIKHPPHPKNLSQTVRWLALLAPFSWELLSSIKYRILLNKRSCLNKHAPWLLNLNGHTSESTEPIWITFLALEGKVSWGPHREFHWNQTRARGRFLSPRLARLFDDIWYKHEHRPIPHRTPV